MFAPTLTRYLVSRLSAHALAVMGIVVVLACMRRLGNYLDAAAGGLLPIDAVLELVGIRTIVAFPSLFPVSLYLGILLALNRLRADREILALEAAGVSPLRVASIVGMLALCCAVFVCVLALAVRHRAAQIFDELASVVRLTGLEAGRFYEIDGGEMVLFAGAKAADGTMRDVFVQRREAEGGSSISYAEQATEVLVSGEDFRLLTLRDGHLYEFGSNASRGPRTITHYREMVVRLPLREPGPEGGRRSAKPTAALLHSADRGDAAELQWRLAMPVSTLLLALSAVSLALTRRSEGTLVAGLALYLAYAQSLNVAKSWIESGILASHPGLWLIHAIWLAGIAITWACSYLRRGASRGR